MLVAPQWHASQLLICCRVTNYLADCLNVACIDLTAHIIVWCLVAVGQLRVLVVYGPVQRDTFREQYEAQRPATQTSSEGGAGSSEGAIQAPQQLQVLFH